VAYERLPDFCTHCLSIEHNVTACRWLYPRKDTTTPKEKIAQGKKQVPTTKTTWVPINDNPSCIGSSAAFGAVTKVVPQQTMATPVTVQGDIDTTISKMETETTTVELELVTGHQESLNTDIPQQITLGASDGTTSQGAAVPFHNGDDSSIPTEDISTSIPTPMIALETAQGSAQGATTSLDHGDGHTKDISTSTPTPVNETASLEKETEIVTLEMETETVEQESMNKDIPLQITLEVIEGAARLGAATSSVQGDDSVNHSEDISSSILTPVVTDTSHTRIIINNTFSMQLENVSDEIVRYDVAENHEHILSPVREKALNVNSIVAPEGASIHPVLQKDLNFMQDWLAKAAVNNEVPFTAVISKS